MNTSFLIIRSSFAFSRKQLKRPLNQQLKSFSSEVKEGLKELSSSKCFGGLQKVFRHKSASTNCAMNFTVYLPPKALECESIKLPVLYFFSGSSRTEQDFIVKSGFQRYAAENNLIVVGPDTSPRKIDHIEGQDEKWYLGYSAGWYMDAEMPPWKDNYRMYSYVTKELPALVEASFPNVNAQKKALCGHSMGGYGAMLAAFKNPGVYNSVSLLAPIFSINTRGDGLEVLKNYLGEDKKNWQPWDPLSLLKTYKGPLLKILLDFVSRFLAHLLIPMLIAFFPFRALKTSFCRFPALKRPSRSARSPRLLQMYN